MDSNKHNGWAERKYQKGNLRGNESRRAETSAYTSLRRLDLSAGKSLNIVAGPNAILAQNIGDAKGGNGG